MTPPSTNRTMVHLLTPLRWADVLGVASQGGGIEPTCSSAQSRIRDFRDAKRSLWFEGIYKWHRLLTPEIGRGDSAEASS
jgi:hypothetical protein